jgi:hypothetical protein
VPRLCSAPSPPSPITAQQRPVSRTGRSGTYYALYVLPKVKLLRTPDPLPPSGLDSSRTCIEHDYGKGQQVGTVRIVKPAGVVLAVPLHSSGQAQAEARTECSVRQMGPQPPYVSTGCRRCSGWVTRMQTCQRLKPAWCPMLQCNVSTSRPKHCTHQLVACLLPAGAC